MAVDYSKVLQAMSTEFIVIGRGSTSANIFKEKTGITPIIGGIDNYLSETTIETETMAIIAIKDTLYLEVSGINEQPTLFKFTEQTDSSFVCENPQNEFPQKINYFLDNKQLKAIVSGDDFRIDFIFEKVN